MNRNKATVLAVVLIIVLALLLSILSERNSESGSALAKLNNDENGQFKNKITGFTSHAIYNTFSAAEAGFVFNNTSRLLYVNDTVVYRTGYYSLNGSTWQNFSLTGTSYNFNVDWLTGNSTITLPDFGEGEHYIIIFSCSYSNVSNISWNCHDDKWQLTIVNNTVAPGANCSDGIKNQNEIFADCGGICAACECLVNQTQTCTIANGTGNQTRNCTYGHYNGTWGVCTVYSCNSGYVINGNGCAAASSGMTWTGELMVNGGFELGSLTGWTSVNGTYGAGFSVGNHMSNALWVSPQSGNYQAWFNGASSTASGVDFYLYQDVDLRSYATYIDTGNTLINASGWGATSEMSQGPDTTRIQFLFLDNSHNVIGTALDSGWIFWVNGTWWQRKVGNYSIPNSTRYVRAWASSYEDCGSNYCDSGTWDSFSVKIGYMDTSACGGSSVQSCNITNGVGSQSRTCNATSGNWSAWSTCTPSSCNSGYTQCGNGCNVSSRSCSITNGAGAYIDYCSSGVWTLNNTCSVVSCNSGYTQCGTKCNLTSRSCTIANGTGSQVGSCNSGVWSFGTCSVVSCNDGYVQSGNTCIPYTPPAAGSTYVINHSNTNLASIPASCITKAKNTLHIAYSHTSHGSQLYSGLQAIETYNSVYGINSESGTGELHFEDYYGYGSDSGFATGGCYDLSDCDGYSDGLLGPTRQFLNSANGQDINVIMWSWCDISGHNIPNYLQKMQTIMAEYGNGNASHSLPVKFVFITGHANGGGVGDSSDSQNTIIRNFVNNQSASAFCKTHQCILFDFSDMENYDPDNNYFLDKYVTDALNYNGGNWGTEYLARHPSGLIASLAGIMPTYGCAHSDASSGQYVNCAVKGQATWYLMARLAGWDGVSSSCS